MPTFLIVLREDIQESFTTLRKPDRQKGGMAFILEEEVHIQERLRDMNLGKKCKHKGS